MLYADRRINGVRAAWALGAGMANDWRFELLSLAGRGVASNRLNGTEVRLVFLFLQAAAGSFEDDVGDLQRMWRDPGFVARPIDGRPAYTGDGLLAVLRALNTQVQPTFLRTLDPWGAGMNSNVDHIYAAHFVLAANQRPDGTAERRCDTYFDYIAAAMPENFGGHWRDTKQAMWDAYRPFDNQVGPTAWNELAGRQHMRRIYWPGDTIDLP
jgi:LmbE family N-acetylglucosaminyl deacetylase